MPSHGSVGALPNTDASRRGTERQGGHPRKRTPTEEDTHGSTGASGVGARVPASAPGSIYKNLQLAPKSQKFSAPPVSKLECAVSGSVLVGFRLGAFRILRHSCTQLHEKKCVFLGKFTVAQLHDSFTRIYIYIP